MDYKTTFFKSEVKNKLIFMLHIMNVEKLKQSISRSFANNSWHQIGSIGSDESKLTTKWELNWVVGEVLDVQPLLPVTVVELVSPLVCPLLSLLFQHAVAVLEVAAHLLCSASHPVGPEVARGAGHGSHLPQPGDRSLTPLHCHYLSRIFPPWEIHP